MPVSSGKLFREPELGARLREEQGRLREGEAASLACGRRAGTCCALGAS